MIPQAANTIRSSIIWSAVRNWAPRFGAVIVFFILARILEKHELGLVAAAVTVAAFVELFAENGIGDTVVQFRDVTQKTLNSAFWINVSVAVVVFAGLWAAADRLEAMMAVPGLAAVLPPVAVGIVFNAISFVPQALLRREFLYRWLGLRALIATFAGGAVGIVLAYAGFGVWALVAQILVVGLLNAVLVWKATSWTPGFDVDWREAVRILRFGWFILLGRLLSFGATRSIEFFIVVSLGPAMLAVYVMGSRISAVLMQMSSAVVTDVSLAGFSRLSDSMQGLREALYSSGQLVAGAITPVFVLASALAPEITRLAYGRNAEGTADILAMVALLNAVEVVQFLCGSAIVATGRPALSTGVMALKCVGVVIVIGFYPYASVDAMVFAYALTLAVLAPVSLVIARRVIGLSLLRWARQILPFFLCSAIMFAALQGIRPYVLEVVPQVFPRLLLLGGLGGLIYLSAVLLIDRDGLKAIIHSVKGRKNVSQT